MTGQQLKNSILQLAIQGRLVAQDPADEPASVLLQRIRQEKQRLVKEGKLKKKDLTSTPITDEEKPFDIPETWEWCRLKDILLVLTDGTHSTPKYTEKGVPFVSVKNMSTGKLIIENTKYISLEEHEELTKRCCPEYGDILLSKVGTTGVPALIDTHTPFSIFVSIALLKFSQDKLDASYLINLINSPLVQEQAKANTRGVGNKNWVIKKIENTLIPLPPLSEQHRIVARIEELMPLVEAYGKAQEELEALNAGLPEALKKSILQEAIQGRLVPQDANDEPASVLLARIRKEKEQLVKAGKLKKKDLTTTPITEEEKPFDIPETWEWCRLGELLSPMETKKPQGDFFDYIDIDAVDNKKQIVGQPKHLAVSAAPSRASRKLHSGDVIYSMVRPYLRNIAIINEEHKDSIASTGFYVCSPFEGLSTAYLYRFLLSPYFTDGMHLLMKGDNSPSINAGDLQGYLIPLPPLSEQRRIVSKIENLFAAIDQMKDLH